MKEKMIWVMWLHHVSLSNPLSTAAGLPDLSEGHWALLRVTKARLGKCSFLCGGQMMDVYWVKHTFIGWFAACWGLQRGACELGSAGESTAGCWGGTGERDCLATVGSPNVSLTKKAWMSYDEGSTHTSPPFNLLYMHTNTHTHTHKHSSG